MAYSLNDITDILGEDAQSVGGNIIVRYENKNVKVAYFNSEDGGFIVTDEGKEILDGLSKSKAPAKKDAKPADKPAELKTAE